MYGSLDNPSTLPSGRHAYKKLKGRWYLFHYSR